MVIFYKKLHNFKTLQEITKKHLKTVKIMNNERKPNNI